MYREIDTPVVKFLLSKPILGHSGVMVGPSPYPLLSYDFLALTRVRDPGDLTGRRDSPSIRLSWSHV